MGWNSLDLLQYAKKAFGHPRWTAHKIRHHCSNKDYCAVPASSKVFGNPYPSMHKYLELHYACRC